MRRVLPLMLLVVVTNVVMLRSVRANRAGEPDATVMLTERELGIEGTSDRDSARKLRLTPGIERPFWVGSGETDWLTPAKLATLGFACRAPTNRLTPTTESCGLPRRAFVAYEYNGPAWQRVVASLQRERDAPWQTGPSGTPRATGSAGSFDYQIRYGSRLFSLDASTDSIALRRAYPDRRRYVILPAMVRAWVKIDQQNQSAAPVVTGTIAPLTTTLMAPARFRDLLLTLGPSDWLLSHEPR